jgi:hypothetical protein
MNKDESGKFERVMVVGSRMEMSKITSSDRNGCDIEREETKL